ncbi:MAG TPA: ExeM/NucH family extracellular endonuclease, partial [Xanthomonadales bacterium]|nr:ExeM/NucH family extracellular endonuclease [Xanthomonadales bacterium]
LLAAACQPEPGPAGSPAFACKGEFTPLSAVQGTGATTPLLGEYVAVTGIVTLVEAGGVYIEQPLADALAETSNGLFLAGEGLATGLAPGDVLMVQGVATELGAAEDSLTALQDISAWQICARGSELPLTGVALPLTEGQRESLEAMHLKLDQALVVTDPWGSPSGRLLLSRDQPLPAPTEVVRPGPDARAQAEQNRRNALAVLLHESDRQPLPAGTQLLSVQGVLGHDGDRLRLQVSEAAHAMAPRLYRIEPPASEDVRVVALNLHNYFNGNGQGGGFPTPRGAATEAEFERQRTRLAAIMGELSPGLVAVMELENDGFGPHSAAADFARDLAGVSGHEWQAIVPASGSLGDGPISVGLFYRPDQWIPEGGAEVLNGPEFRRLSRPPLAQAFQDRASGEVLLVVVNHLKSKGSCPSGGNNANLQDGQACWNPARTLAARAMAEWAKSLAAARAGGRLLVLGDMNAYRMEDPITALIEAGLKDLTAPSGPRPHFSFIYRGEAGTLDYAFASEALRPFVQSAHILNVNSTWPPDVELPFPWLGTSDHDPVVVDLRLRKAVTRD